jgi:hypothetical protein
MPFEIWRAENSRVVDVKIHMRSSADNLQWGNVAGPLLLKDDLMIREPATAEEDTSRLARTSTRVCRYAIDNQKLHGFAWHEH